MRKKLGSVLKMVHKIGYKAGGGYSIFIPCDELNNQIGKLKASTDCAVYFITREEDLNGFRPPDVNMCELSTVSFVLDIVQSARNQKPDVTEEELVMCLNHYLLNDAYYEF